MSVFALRQFSEEGEASSLILSYQDKVNSAEQMYDAAPRENDDPQKYRMLCVCARINSSCCYLLSRICNNISWIVGRAKEIFSKANEIPYFMTHPNLIISLLYRQRVKDAMANLQAIRTTTTLSKIEPCHSIEGNLNAEKKCRERVETLRKHKVQFDLLLNQGAPISQKFVDNLMKSPAPMQCVFDDFRKNFITFNGTGRLFSLKTFFQEEYSSCDPEIEIDVYRVNPDLIKRAISAPEKVLPAEGYRRAMLKKHKMMKG